LAAGGILFGMLATALPTMAAVTGDWSGSLNTPNGDITIGFTFAEKGKVLTGTTTGPDGAPAPIANGKVDGDKIAFDVTIDMGGQAATLAYTGVAKGDKIDLTIDFMGMPISLTVSKVAAKPKAK
jgi:hypothetical protein